MGQCKGSTVQQNQMNNSKQFDYQLIYSLNTIEKMSGYQFLMSFGVNYQNTYMVAGSDQQIFVFQFKEGIIKQMKILLNHKHYISTLNFFKQNEIFISGSRDGSFILWSINQMQNGKYLFKVNAHSDFINCIALPQSAENFLITGSNDCTIKIWSSFNNTFSQFQCSQKITEHSQSVFGLSTNNSGNQFVSCGKDGLILVMQKGLSQNWILKQRIQSLAYGYRISFLTDFIFSFQPTFPHPNNYLLIYQLDTRTQLYVQVQQLLVKGDRQSCSTNFPMLYNLFQNVLLDKNGTYLNIISFDREQEQNNQFNLEKAINFNTETFYGTQLHGIHSLFQFKQENTLEEIDCNKLIYLSLFNSQKSILDLFSILQKNLSQRFNILFHIRLIFNFKQIMTFSLINILNVSLIYKQTLFLIFIQYE